MSASIYRSSGGEAEILALYDGALTRLGVEYESTKIDTRFGDTHVLVTGPENAPPLVILPGGIFQGQADRNRRTHRPVHVATVPLGARMSRDGRHPSDRTQPSALLAPRPAPRTGKVEPQPARPRMA